MTDRETYEREAEKQTEETAGNSLDDMEKVNGLLHIQSAVDITFLYYIFSVLLFYNVCFLHFLFYLKKLVDIVPQFIPQHLICPLTKKMFIDPVKTVYGTVYERKAIEEHLKQWVHLLLMTVIKSESLVMVT